VAQPSKITRLRDLIAFFLPDYLRLVEPDLVAHLDLSEVGYPHLPFAPQTIVAEVCTRERETVTVLVRVEAEAASTAAAGEGLARSLRALRVPLGEPVWLSTVPPARQPAGSESRNDARGETGPSRRGAPLLRRLRSGGLAS
jgi:hypothetical protein